MKGIFKVIKNLITLFLVLVICSNLWMIAQRVFFDEDLPKTFGFFGAVVVSGSMEPTLDVGDVAVFRETGEYEVDDVVIFRVSESLVTHRIISETSEGFITQGDANNTADSDILLYSNIEGELIFSLPGFGTVMNFFSSTMGIVLLILLGFALIEIPKIYDRKNEEKQDDCD